MIYQAPTQAEFIKEIEALYTEVKDAVREKAKVGSDTSSYEFETDGAYGEDGREISLVSKGREAFSLKVPGKDIIVRGEKKSDWFSDQMYYMIKDRVEIEVAGKSVFSVEFWGPRHKDKSAKVLAGGEHSKELLWKIRSKVFPLIRNELEKSAVQNDIEDVVMKL